MNKPNLPVTDDIPILDPKVSVENEGASNRDLFYQLLVSHYTSPPDEPLKSNDKYQKLIKALKEVVQEIQEQRLLWLNTAPTMAQTKVFDRLCLLENRQAAIIALLRPDKLREMFEKIITVSP